MIVKTWEGGDEKKIFGKIEGAFLLGHLGIRTSVYLLGKGILGLRFWNFALLLV